MTFNLVNRFILWLKKILHIRPVKVTQQPEEKTGEVSPEEELQEPSGEEILTPEPSQGSSEIETGPQIKYPPEEAKTEEKIKRKEEKDTPEPEGPSIKKPPTTKIVYKTPKEKGFDTIIKSPFVEIDLDNAKVYLILPQQQLKPNPIDQTPLQLTYVVILNETRQEVPAKIINGIDGHILVEEKRIFLEEPLVKIQVAFRDKIQGKEYNYSHKDKGLYAFVAIGSNRGRMYDLYDKEGKIIDLPKRDVWILLNEDFELQTEPDVIEERWIWEKYQPFRINLSKIDALVIKNRISGEEKTFSLQSTYRVEGEQLIEDDYKKECPLFTGKTLKIVAPYENQPVWSVWIQNKAAGYVKENWTGREPLILNCPEDLPCDCGEFQVDICQQDTRISDETLFFRLMPCIELNYPKELIIPDPKSGHIPLTISIRLDSNDEWGLEYRENREIRVEKKGRNFYEIELPPEEDTSRFTLAKTSRPESIVNFQVTVLRLRWKTSKQKVWNSRLQNIERKDLKSGEPFYLRIRTNDFDNKYDLSAMLETNGQKLQEGKFIRKGIEYSLELNQFFDTIKTNKDALTLKAEIRKDNKLLGIPEILYIEVAQSIPISRVSKPVYYDLINAVPLQRICFVLRRIKDVHPKEKIRCKEILKVYYKKIRRKNRPDREDFVIKSLAFIKFIMDIYGDKALIKDKRKWRKRIDLLQKEYKEKFDNVFNSFGKR